MANIPCSCPDCSESATWLYEIDDAGFIRFRAWLCPMHQRVLWTSLKALGFVSDRKYEPLITIAPGHLSPLKEEDHAEHK